MTFITLFSAPKPFINPHIATIQRNAILSWTLLPDVEVILIGEEEGLAEFARGLGVKHIPQAERNANGVPLTSSMFALARKNSSGDLLCIVNADMILLPDFVQAAKQAARLKDKFVLLSQRWDLDITHPIEFTEGWQNRLLSTVHRQGQLHRPAGSDFFLFPKSCYANIPAFTIGRAGWDNWMIYKARKEGWAVIDATPSLAIVHQNHDYSHLPGGKAHYNHPETNENICLAGGQANVRYTILDSTHQLAGGKLIRPPMTSLRLMRKLELFLRAVFFFLPENVIENAARPKRWKKRIQKIVNRKSEIGNRIMRKGQNPAKFVKDVARPERITAALLNYIPFLSGFYAETLDVLKVSLESMRKDAGLPFDLMVFDNGSCAEVRDFLIHEKEEGRIQYLILSEKNMGKGGAWNMTLAGAPGEIIAYTDADVLFSPNWLKRSVEILETFPHVGMVTARPFRTPPEFYESTLQWARDNAILEEGQFIPWETFLEFNLSLGQTKEENEKAYAETRDWRIQYKGVTAMAGASHWQFTAYKSTLQRFLPFDMDKPMGQVRQLDKRMNDAGLLRLMVSDPLAMNMSNTLGYLRGELGKRDVKIKKGKGVSRRILEAPPIKKALLAVYNRIFSWYYS